MEKFCAICDHCITFNRSADKFECNAPQNKTDKFDLVTGQAVKVESFCYAQRYIESDKVCGSEGKWWTPRVRGYGQDENKSSSLVKKVSSTRGISADDL